VAPDIFRDVVAERADFRGEALASVGAVARLSIESRHVGEENAWAIVVEGGRQAEPIPAVRHAGTHVEVRDLFFATPARSAG